MTNNSTPIGVLICAPIMGRDLSPVRSLGPSVNVIDGNDAFDAVQKAMREGDADGIALARKEFDRVLAQAEVVCMGAPVLKQIVGQAPLLKWVHHTQAGVSNLWASDIWAAQDLVLTSGRGFVRPAAMAEYCIAGAMAFARGVHSGFLDKSNGKLDRTQYKLKLIEGSTMGIIGLGGIGKEVARLARGLGMRVVATRRSVETAQTDVDGANLLLAAAQLKQLASESDFIAVCTQLTSETHHLLNRDFFAAAAKTPVVMNISRGEVIDEVALLEALEAGRVHGALLDVYEGETEGRPPRQELWDSPRVIITPHVSAGGSSSTAGDATSGNMFMQMFIGNLRRYVDGEPLLNIVDRTRGY